jgi:hypothetical protein
MVSVTANRTAKHISIDAIASISDPHSLKHQIKICGRVPYRFTFHRNLADG